MWQLFVNWLAVLSADEQAIAVGVAVSLVVALLKWRWPGIEATKARIATVIAALLAAGVTQAAAGSLNWKSWLIAVILTWVGSQGAYGLGKPLLPVAARILRASQDK